MKHRVVLYKGSWIKHFRIFVKFKVLQFAGCAGLCAPLAAFYATGSLALDVAVASGIVCFASFGGSLALWFYSRRYIGEMSLIDDRFVCISTLDFWGDREDRFIEAKQIVPPLARLPAEEAAKLTRQMFVPLHSTAATFWF